jgi:hypothetical protein
MISNIRIVALAIILSALMAYPISRAAEDPKSQQEKQLRTRELQKIAAELREAILRGDIETLLKYIVVGPNDFNSYEDAKLALHMRDYSIRCLLFDTKCQEEMLRRGGGENNPYRISVAEFFEKHPDLRIEVRFFGGKDSLQLAQLLYIARGSTYDARFPNWLKDKFPEKQWGKEYVAACMKYTEDGWRYFSDIFVC